MSKAPGGWDLIRLSSPAKRSVVELAPLRDGRRLVCYSHQPTLAGAVLVSAAGAHKLLTPRIRYRAVDQDTRRPWEFGLRVYGVVPTPVTQNAEYSYIETMGGRRTSLDPWRRLRRAVSLDRPLRALYNMRLMGPTQYAKCTAANFASHFW